MAEETSTNLEGKRVSTTFRGLLHFPKSIDTTLSKQIVYDGVGTATALTLGGDTKGIDVSGPLTCTGGLSTGGNFAANGNTTIQGNATIQGDITLVDGGKINDIDIYSSASAVSLRAPNTSEVGKLRIRETASDYEMLFGNPTVTEKNLFSIIVKNDTSNNLYIKNNYSDFDYNAPLWINRATGEVNIRTLRVNNIKTVLPPGVSTPPNQESTYGPSNRNVLPVGMIVMFPVSGVPSGWIPCDGKEHNKQTLPELFNVIGYNYSVSKSGDLFQVPDYRGLFVRGVDYKRTDEGSHTFIDPDGARILDGSIQEDAFESHRHQLPYNTNNHGGGSLSDTGEGSSNYISANVTDFTGDVETRPKNVVALYCIKW
jgi:microcystin-dependent protein